MAHRHPQRRCGSRHRPGPHRPAARRCPRRGGRAVAAHGCAPVVASGRTDFLFDDVVTVDSAVIQRETSARTQKSSDNPSGGPVRTCIGCRRRELAVDLLRVVAVGGGQGPGNDTRAVTVDAAKRLPGRGAWLHPDPGCLREAVRRRAFGRALRIAGSPDITAVVERFEEFGTSESPRAREQVAKNMSTP
ncbi:YlxR family protein [Mycolicibacterium obuense]|uniref:YlxR family protein n=1 Tax=Mycolicibacterium obuense TaxID=1807 RepID=A0A4R5X7L3_9MYCO|nr:YlxR family protein [Mycolicibacterium obuense]TDL09578.1 YlxR family protein [Mycolicibacterium obuense]